MFEPGQKATNRPPQMYCSKSCAASATNTARYPAGRDLEREATRALEKCRKRRGLISAAAWDDVTDAEIFERDGWVCQICLEPIDRVARHPEPWSRSIDHIVPLARGGDHTAANKQAAHLRCNRVKGAARV